MVDNYKLLNLHTSPMKVPERDVIGRDDEMNKVLASLMRPELCNVMLLGDAGSGKTMLVQGVSIKDVNREYREVDLASMIADLSDPNELATKLKGLFDEAVAYRSATSKELVLFIDEFHQIIQLSAAAVEALKPILADSGTRGIKIIAATTFREFREFIAPNQPLVERLQRINLAQPPREVVVSILKGMVDKYEASHSFFDESIYDDIYEYTNRYIPSSSQPRKSLLVVDSMIGWHRFTGESISKDLLAKVIYESVGVKVTFTVDANTIKQKLDTAVLSQELATKAIEERLQVAVADLHRKDRPMSSFLFTGSTGTGKTEMTKQLAKLLFDDEKNLIRFDMTEYANEDSLDRFRAELTARAWERPYSIILLDEIEKACAPVTRILLQVLDDGRLIDEHGKEVSFVNAYVVLTTNAGSEIYETLGNYTEGDMGKELQKYMALIRESITSSTGANRFPPELLGRIDTIVPFGPLSNETSHAIVKRKLMQLSATVKTLHNVNIVYGKKLIRYLVNDKMTASSKDGGARRVMSVIESEVVTNVARFVNENDKVKTIIVEVEGQLRDDDKNVLESTAYVTVRPI